MTANMTQPISEELEFRIILIWSDPLQLEWPPPHLKIIQSGISFLISSYHCFNRSWLGTRMIAGWPSLICKLNAYIAEIVLPLHRDGSFQFIEVDQLVHVHMCFYYKYIGAIGHLPFRIKVMKNDEEVYNEKFGEFDKYDALNKILDHLVVDANIGDTIKFYNLNFPKISW